MNAAESAFRILAKMSEGTEASFIDQMMSSHPDSKKRADDAKKRAEQDGLYKAYVQQKIANGTPVKKAAVKKTAVKKKK